MSRASRYTVEEALAHIGVGRFQLSMLAFCGAAMVGDAMEKGSISYMIKVAKTAWHIDGGQLSLVGSISALGQVIGALFFGWLSDARGRKFGLVLALLTTSVFGLLSAASVSFAMFLAMRFWINVGLAGALPCAFTLFTEFIPICDRSRWIPSLYAAFGVGRLFASVVAFATTHSPWYVLVAVLACPGALLLLFCPLASESPQFYLAHGETEKAMEVLSAVSFRNGRSLPEGSLTRDTTEAATGASIFHPVFSDSTSILIMLLWFFIYVSGEWSCWALTIYENSGLSETKTYVGLMPFQACELVSPLLVLLAMPTSAAYTRTGSVLGILSASTAVLVAITVIVSSFHSGLAVVVISCLAVYTYMALSVVLYMVTPSYFPAEVRGLGMGLCTMCGRLGSVVGPLIIGRFIPSGSVTPICACAALSLFVGAAAAKLSNPVYASSETSRLLAKNAEASADARRA